MPQSGYFTAFEFGQPCCSEVRCQKASDSLGSGERALEPNYSSRVCAINQSFIPGNDRRGCVSLPMVGMGPGGLLTGCWLAGRLPDAGGASHIIVSALLLAR